MSICWQSETRCWLRGLVTDLVKLAGIYTEFA
jgi:hypothetical protein